MIATADKTMMIESPAMAICRVGRLVSWDTWIPPIAATLL